VECIEHYWYEEHYTTTSHSNGRGGITVHHHTRTVHRYHASFARESFPFYVDQTTPFSAKSAQSYLPVGAHHLRFAVALPADAPCTFRAGHSEIFYKLSVASHCAAG
jgi:hypothetical protein